jgi:hypothetical protein
MKAGGVYELGDKTQALERKLKLMLGPAAGTSAEDKKQAAQQRAAIAVDFAKFTAKQDFDADIMALRHKSSVPVPAWLEAAAASGKIGKIDKNAVIALIHQAPTVEEKQKRQAEVVAYYDSAVAQQNKSIMFQVSAYQTEKFKAQIAMGGVIGDLFKGMDAVGGEINSAASSVFKTLEENRNYRRDNASTI